MNLTLNLDHITILVSKRKGYKAVREMFQLAHSYGIKVGELEELVYEELIEPTIQTVIYDDKEERIDAFEKIMDAEKVERERLNRLGSIELEHFFYLLIKALRHPLESEFDKRLSDVIADLTRLLDYYKSRELEEKAEELERFIFDLTEASTEEFGNLHYRFNSLIDFDEMFVCNREMHDYLEHTWVRMRDLWRCTIYLNDSLKKEV